MMITYRSRLLARAEVWYDNAPDDLRSVDWMLYQQRSQPVPGLPAEVFYTRLVDLGRSREQLQADLNKDTAYKIRRARERDGIVCECCNPLDPAVLDRFEQMFNTFAALKGLSRLNRARMEGMAAAGVLDLSAARDPQGNALVYHANYRDRHRATSLELPSLYRNCSDSAERNLIGRANRYLTWSDILRYQEQGLKGFDFGGWYPGSTDRQRLDINRFKEGFGGRVVREYNCEQIVSFKGRVVLAAAAMLNRAAGVTAKFRPAARRRELAIDAPNAGAVPSSASPAAETAVLGDPEVIQ